MRIITQGVSQENFINYLNENFTELNYSIYDAATIESVVHDDLDYADKIITNTDNILTEVSGSYANDIVIGMTGKQFIDALNKRFEDTENDIINSRIGTDLVLKVEQASVSEIQLEVMGYNGADAVVIDYGDGSTATIIMDGTIRRVGHTYGSTGIKTISISNAQNIEEFSLVVGKLTGIYTNMIEFATATNLKKLIIYETGKGWSGSLNGLNKEIEVLYFFPITANNTVKGNMERFLNLQIIDITGNASGDMSLCTTLERFFMRGNVTITLNCDNMVNMLDCESYADGGFGDGDLAKMTTLSVLCWGTPNRFYGDITNNAYFTYLDHYGNTGGDVITGNLTNQVNRTNIWKFLSRGTGVGKNRFTGSISGMINLEMFTVADDSVIDKPATLIEMTKLGYFTAMAAWQLTQANVNQYLADIKANKDTGGRISSSKYVNLALNPLSAAPSGQGITDKTDLQNAGWTIVTN